MDKFFTRKSITKNTTKNVENVPTERFGETYVADLQSPPHKVETKNNASIDVALHLDASTEVPQTSLKLIITENSEVAGVLWPLDWSAEQWAQKKRKTYMAFL